MSEWQAFYNDSGNIMILDAVKLYNLSHTNSYVDYPFVITS